MTQKGIPHLAGQTALITGAANGIGRELARGLFQKGCHLALVDIDQDGLDAIAAGFREKDPERTVTAHRADVSDRGQMAVLAQQVRSAHPALHILINNAGVGHEAPFQQTSLETWDRVIGVNLWGVIHGCHFFLPMLAKAERAHIVNLSSLFGYMGMAGQTPYCTTKYAVRGFSESLWEELRDTRVGLTVVHPGSIATDIMRTAEGDDPDLMAHLAGWYDQNAFAPEKAAARIIAAVQKGTPRLLITPEAYLVDVVKRLMPVTGNRIVCDLILKVLKLEHMREKRKRLWQETMVDGDPWT